MPFLVSRVRSSESVDILGEFTMPAAQYVAGNQLLCVSYQKRVLGQKTNEQSFEQLLEESPSCESQLCARKDHEADPLRSYAKAHRKQGGECRQL